MPKRDDTKLLSVQQQKAQTAAAEKHIQTLKELALVEKSIADSKEEYLKSQEKLAEQLKDAHGDKKKDLELQQQINKEAWKAFEVAQGALELRQEINSKLPDALTNRQAIHEANMLDTEVLKRKVDLSLTLGHITKDEAKNMKKHFNALAQQTEKLSNISSHTSNILEATTGVSDAWRDTIVGQVMATEGGMEEVLKTITATLSPANLLGSYMMKVQEATVAGFHAFDSATASLNSLTGAGGAYNSQITEIASSTRALGVGFEGAAEAIGELHVNMTGFTDLTKSAQTEIAKTTIGLSKLGISGSVTAKSIDDLMKGLGMSKEAATAVQEDMAKMAIALGIPPAQMAEGFASAMPQLASWGKEAPEIFKKVAGAAKKLGVQMETLLGFSAQFDTFDSAATAVGKLNSILGGDLLNSYEMMNASAEERNELLLESIEFSGKSWESMNRFEKMAVANAAGITDMNEAQKLFSGGLSAYREGINTTAASQEELERRQKASASVSEKLAMIMESLAIAVQPLVWLAHVFIDFFTYLDPIAWLLGSMVGIFVALAAVTKVYAMWTAILASGLWGQAKAQEEIVVSGPPAAGAIGVLGSVSAVATPAVGALAIGMGLLALGFGLVALSIAAVVGLMVYLIVTLMKSPMAAVKAAGAMALLAASIYALVLVLPSMLFVAAGIAAIGFALRSIPESKTISFSTAMDSLAGVSKISSTNIEGVKGIVEQAVAYLEVQANFKAPNEDAFVQALTKAQEIKSEIAGTKAGGKDIVLVLNGREIGRAIDVHLGDKHSVKTQ